MRRREQVRTTLSISTELLTFMWHCKAWWLTPIVVFLLLLSGLVVVLESSALAPFVYALF